MLELGNVLNVSYGAWVVSGVYNRIDDSGDSTQIPDDDMAVAIIKSLLGGRIDDDWRNVHYANEVISAIQALAEAATEIDEKVGRMKELAGQAATGTYSDEELAEMQEELEQLAEEINNIVENTECDGNKLFSAEGETLSISIGNGSTIDIVAKDLSIDIEGLDLANDAEGALAAIEGVIAQSDYYSGYVNKQVERLESVVMLIEYDAKNALGFEPEDFDMGFAEQVARSAASKVLEDMSILFDIQANVMPERALGLLKDMIEERAEAAGDTEWS